MSFFNFYYTNIYFGKVFIINFQRLKYNKINIFKYILDSFQLNGNVSDEELYSQQIISHHNNEFNLKSATLELTNATEATTAVVAAEAVISCSSSSLNEEDEIEDDDEEFASPSSGDDDEVGAALDAAKKKG